MANFLQELKRRHIYRMAAAYVVVSWLILQVVNNVAPGLNLPNTSITLVIVLLAAGFPIALIFAWILELNAPASDHHSMSQAKITTLDASLLGALALVIATFVYQQFMHPQASQPVQRQANIEERAVSANQTDGISIAVLPFENLSGDPGQEFFSDGMTEEITAALAKVTDLRVVARTSAFQFKAQNRDIQSIGEQLHATHFIEGSVRKAGNRVRITAQLIKAGDDTHIWSENYDRELTDVFAVQEEIARAITAALRTPLGLAEGASLVANRTRDEASYEDYLRARMLVRERATPSGVDQLSQAIALLERVVARDPDYAPAWALLSLAHAFLPVFHPAVLNGDSEAARGVVQSHLAKAEEAAAHAGRLDPKSAEAQLGMATVQYSRGKWLVAADLYARVLATDPDNPDALHLYSMMLGDLGYIGQAFAMRQRLLQIDPFVTVFKSIDARLLWVTGQTEQAQAVLPAITPTRTGSFIRAHIQAAQGRYSEAADALLPVTSDDLSMRTAEAARVVLRSLPKPPAQFPNLGAFDFVYLYAGAPEHALDEYDGLVQIGFLGGGMLTYVWGRPYEAVRKTERFKALVRNSGMFDFWRAKGPPDFCRSLGIDDFVCM